MTFWHGYKDEIQAEGEVYKRYESKKEGKISWVAIIVPGTVLGSS